MHHTYQKRMQLFLIYCLVWSTLSTSSGTENRRMRRFTSGEKMAPIVENMQRLARITNGIFLEIGLIDGSIASDAAVSELLHMSSLKPSEIIKIDYNRINSAFSQLNGLPKSLDSSGELLKFEARLVALEGMTKLSDSIGNFSVIPGKKEFETSLESVKKLDSLSAELGKLLATVNSLESTLGPLVELPEEITDEIAKANIVSFPFGLAKLKEMEKMLSNFNKAHETLKTAKGIEEHSKFLDLLFSEHEFRKVLNVKMPYDDDLIKLLKGNFRKTFEVLERFKESEESLKFINQLRESRRKSKIRSFTYSAGLPNGAIDLEKLTEDTNNDWFLNRIKNGSKISENLKKSFSLYDDLVSELKNIDSAWSPLSDDTELPSFKVSETKITIEEIFTLVDSLKTCEEKTQSYPNYDIGYLEGFKKSVDALNSKMREISSFEYLDQLKNLNALKESLETENKNEAEKIVIVKRTVAKLKSDPEMKKILDTVKLLNEDLKNSVKAIPEIPALAKNVKTNVVDGHHNVIKVESYLQIYECLGKHKRENTPIQQLIERIKDVRSVPNNAAPSEENPIIQALSYSKNGLTNSENEAKKLKDVKIPEALAFKKSNSEDSSRKLGLAVQGLNAIKIASESRESLKPLIENVEEVQKAASTLAPEHQDSLKKLTEIKSSLGSTFSEIDKFSIRQRKRGVRSSGNDGFEDFGNILIAASTIPGVQYEQKEIAAIGKAIKELNSVTLSKFVEFEKALNLLEDLELNFARFKFQEAVPTLKDVDEFFSSYLNQVDASIPVAKSSQIPRIPATTVSTWESPTTSSQVPIIDESKTFPLYVWLIIVVVIIAILAVVAWAVRKWGCATKPPPSPPLPPPPPPPPIPDVPVVPPSAKVDPSNSTSLPSVPEQTGGDKKEEKPIAPSKGEDKPQAPAETGEVTPREPSAPRKDHVNASKSSTEPPVPTPTTIPTPPPLPTPVVSKPKREATNEKSLQPTPLNQEERLSLLLRLLIVFTENGAKAFLPWDYLKRELLSYEDKETRNGRLDELISNLPEKRCAANSQ